MKGTEVEGSATALIGMRRLHVSGAISLALTGLPTRELLFCPILQSFIIYVSTKLTSNRSICFISA